MGKVFLVASAAFAASSLSVNARSATTSGERPPAFFATPTVPFVIRGGASSSAGDAPEQPNRRKKKHDNESNSETAHTSTDKNKHSSRTPPKSQSHVVNEILKEDEYYKILGVDKTASPKAIIKAYRKRCVHCHPDKTGGNRQAFDKVAEAYDVLSNDSKRKVYDRHGKKGVDQHNQGGAMPHGMAPEDFFRSFFGGDTADPFGAAQPQNRSMRFQVQVTLGELYTGKSFHVQIGRKTVKFEVPRGAFHQQQIVIDGAMDNSKDEVPGDLHFILQQRPHPIFTRQGHDLLVEIKISLSEALTGVKRRILHLDGTAIDLCSAGTQNDAPTIIASGDVQVLTGYGMPKDARGLEFGGLFVRFVVELPKTNISPSNPLTVSERKELARLLDKLDSKDAGRQHSEWPYGGNVKRLKKASIRDFGRHGHDEEQQHRRQHGNFGFPFAQSFGGGGGSQSFFWSSSSTSESPFGNRQPDVGDDEAQCRQM